MRNYESGRRAVETSVSVGRQGKPMDANEKPKRPGPNDMAEHINRSRRAMPIRFDLLNQTHNLTTLGTTTRDRVGSCLLCRFY